MLSEDEEARFAAIVGPLRTDFADRSRPASLTRRVIIGFAALAGMGLLVAGVALAAAAVGVLGFLVMLAAVATYAHERATAATLAATRPTKAQTSPAAWAERRWEKRRRT